MENLRQLVDEMVEYGFFDHQKRAEEKEASLRQDAEDLKSGRITQADLLVRNGFFNSLDMKQFRIAQIGDLKIEKLKSDKLSPKDKL